MKKIGLRVHNYDFLLWAYTLLAAVIFAFFARPAIENELPIRLWADSDTYIRFALENSELTNLITIGGNYLGPFVWLKILNQNSILIFMSNIFLLFLALKLVLDHYKLNKFFFVASVLLNPLTFVSLLLINKEIFGLVSLAFLAAYLKKRKIIFIVSALVFSIFTRWHETAVIVFFLPLENRKIIFRKNVLLTSLGVLLLIGFTYPFFQTSFSFVNDTSTNLLESQTARAFGILPILNQMQNNYLYFFAFFPKAFFNLFGNFMQALSINFYLDRIENNDYYSFFIVLHQLWMFIFLLYATCSKKLFLNKTLFLFLAVYTIIYSLGLFVQYRYFFPLVILIALMVSEKHKLRETV